VTFQPNIPQATDLISVSQNDILQNFQSIDTAWNVNHEDFNASGAGKHKFVEYTNQSSDPAGAASEFTLFSKVSGGGQSEIFYKRNAEGTSYQLTGINPSGAASGYTFLPGAMLMQWDFLTGASKNDGAAIVFPTAFGATPYTLQLTASRNGISVNVLNATSVTSTGFTLRTSSNSNDGVWYLAVGPA
jgi:hypothetical protein